MTTQTNSTEKIAFTEPETLSEGQQELLELYEEAFALPAGTVEESDERSQQLEAVDSLAAEAEQDKAFVGLLRHTAFLRVEDAKRRQASRLATQGAAASSRAEPSLTAKRRGESELPGVRPTLALRAFKQLGFEVVRGGGKGSHVKISNPETGKTTTVPEHRGRDLPPNVLRKILRQVGISPEVFKKNL